MIELSLLIIWKWQENAKLHEHMKTMLKRGQIFISTCSWCLIGRSKNVVPFGFVKVFLSITWMYVCVKLCNFTYCSLFYISWDLYFFIESSLNFYKRSHVRTLFLWDSLWYLLKRLWHPLWLQYTNLVEIWVWVFCSTTLS